MRDARADFESRRQLRRVLRSRLVTLALLGLAFLVGRAAWGMYGAYREAAAARAEAEEELAQIEESYGAVAGDAAALETRAGVEKRLRASLNVAAPGEEAVVIVRRAGGEPEVSAAAPRTIWNLWGLLD
jgi:cell division protein FtsB